MGTIRINDLSRELGIKSKQVLLYLSELNLTREHSHSSSIDDALASRVRAHFRTVRPAVQKVGPRRTSEPPAVPKPPGTILHRKSPNDSVKCKFCKRRFVIADMPRHLKSHLPARPVRYENPKRSMVPAGRALADIVPLQTARNPEPMPPQRVPCKLCQLGVFPADMGDHYKTFHTPEKPSSLPDIRSAKHSFIILPPGEAEYREVLDHYVRQSKSHTFLERVIDWDRLVQIATLKPRMRHFGVESWFGYAVYEFTYSHRVVLECPITGNATYVLSGDWGSMIRLSKSDLRNQHATYITRIFHTGNWLRRISAALRKR